MNKWISYILLGIILILLIGKCDSSSHDYEYKQEKLTIEIDSLTGENDTHFFTIDTLQSNSIQPLEIEIDTNMSRLNIKDIEPDIRDTIIKQQDTLIDLKDVEIQYKDTIIRNLQVKEVRYVSKLELKDLEIVENKKNNRKNIFIAILTTVISVAVLVLLLVK